jgi:hypothetical protein
LDKRDAEKMKMSLKKKFEVPAARTSRWMPKGKRVGQFLGSEF